MSENGRHSSSFTRQFRGRSFGTILGDKRYSIWVKPLLGALQLLEQPSLFSDLELRQIRHSGLNASPSLEISASTLQDWKQRIFQYQQQMMEESVRPAQATLFEGQNLETDLETLNPFGLRSQNIEFWRWPAHEPGLAALYFVIDNELPLVLYVGETCHSSQRWKGVHDCKRYVRNYIEAHRPHNLPVSVGIGFWPHAPEATRPRQKMERSLIEKWRSPFNKENWRHWGTPFIGGKH
jgi:hypothetical protein